MVIMMQRKGQVKAEEKQGDLDANFSNLLFWLSEKIIFRVQIAFSNN